MRSRLLRVLCWINVKKNLSLAKRLTAFRPVGDLDGAFSETLVIDGQTLANLEILENANGDPQVCPPLPSNHSCLEANTPFESKLCLDTYTNLP